MYKKIISLFLALCLSISCLSLPISAESSNSDVSSACGKYFSLLSDYLNNKITYEAFQDKTAALYHDIDNSSDRDAFSSLVGGLTNAAEGVSYASSNVSGAFVKSLRDVMTSFDSFYDFSFDTGMKLEKAFEYMWNQFCKDKGYTSSAVNMNGYGALLRFDGIISSYPNSTFWQGYLYCDYFSVQYINDNRSFYSYCPEGNYLLIATDGTSVIYNYSASWVNDFLDTSSDDVSVFGDVRYLDGSPADDIKTPNDENPISPEDLPSDVDLSSFLKKFLDLLQNQFPDTSTIEGLLRAILAKCSSIDAKMDETGSGMNPDELSLLLDKAVLSLTVQNQTNTDALLAELISIRETLQGYKDEEIPPEEADSILQGLISGITSGLISLAGLDIDVSEIIEICEDAGDLGISVLRGIVNIIGILNAAVPLQAVNALITTLTGIIFNLNEPTDLTFNLNGSEVVFIPVNLLSVPQIAGALNIIKGLVTIIVAYSWLKWARKFFLSQF